MARVEIELVITLDSEFYGEYDVEDPFDQAALTEHIRDDLMNYLDDGNPEIFVRDVYSLD